METLWEADSDQDMSLLHSPTSMRDWGSEVVEPDSNRQGEGKVPSACSWAEEMERESRVEIRDKAVQTG